MKSKCLLTPLRDSVGSIMANAKITVRVSIIDSATGGGVVYSEIQKDWDESIREVFARIN